MFSPSFGLFEESSFRGRTVGNFFFFSRARLVRLTRDVVFLEKNRKKWRNRKKLRTPTWLGYANLHRFVRGAQLINKRTSGCLSAACCDSQCQNEYVMMMGTEIEKRFYTIVYILSPITQALSSCLPKSSFALFPFLRW